MAWINDQQLWLRLEICTRKVLSLWSGSYTSCIQWIFYKYRTLFSVLHWDQSRSCHNYKPGVAEAGCFQGLVVLLLLLLGLEEFLIAVAYRDWLLWVASLQSWLIRSWHGSLKSVVMISRFLVLLYPCTYELSRGIRSNLSLNHSAWVCFQSGLKFN